MASCPSCARAVEQDAWFCPYCAAPLAEPGPDLPAAPPEDATDTVSEPTASNLTIDEDWDALLLGELPEEGDDLLGVDTIRGEGSDGSGSDGRYLLYADAHQARALEPDAVPRRGAGGVAQGLEPLEHAVLAQVDGARTIEALARAVGVRVPEVVWALLTLKEAGLVALGEAEPDPVPAPRGAARVRVATPRRPATPVARAPTARQQAAAGRLFAAAERDRDAGNFHSAGRNLALAEAFTPAPVPEAFRRLAAELAEAAGAPTRPLPRDQEARRLFHHAEAREAAGDVDGAIAALEAALAAAPEPMLYNRLGVIRAMRRADFEGALTCLEAAVAAAPEHRAYVHNLQKVRHALARRAGARPEAPAPFWRRLLSPRS